MTNSIVDQPSPEHPAAAEGENRAKLLRAYTDAVIAAQTSHEAWDWIAAGSAFKRYAEAAVAEATSGVEH